MPKITHKKKAYTTTYSRSGQEKLTDRYPLLARELSGGGEPEPAARSASANNTTSPARRVVYTTNSSGSNARSTSIIPVSTSGVNLNFSDANNDRRGEKITIHTLADYLSDQGLYSAEDFMHNATQLGPNRGRELYRALSLRDWEKKLTQAVDIAQSYTPDVSYRQRVEGYTVPPGFNIWLGVCTYNEYKELFDHHAIDIDKIRRWFKTLIGENGKKNTIYMWGKADAGKTTIIKLFDAFYA